MANKIYGYSLELLPTLFTVRLFDESGSLLIISEVTYTIKLTNGIEYQGTTENGKIEISWYNVSSILVDSGECWEEEDIQILTADYIIKFKDVNLTIKPCVSDNHVNQGNYFLWQELQGVTITETDVKLCSERFKECFGIDLSKKGIPNPYIKNPCTKHFPIITPFQETTFYINLNEPILSAVVNDYELGIVDEFNNIVIPSIGNIQKYEVNIGGDYIYYADQIQPEKDQLIDCKNYRFLIYDKSTEESIYVSNPWKFQFKDLDNSTYLEYRNSASIYNIDYSGLPDFKNKIRLKLYAPSFNGESELSPYRSDSSGEVRNLEGTLDKYFVIETYWFDELAHVATLVMNQHDEIQMNGISYTIKTPHQVEENINSIVKKGIFEVYDSQFSKINKFCS